MMLARDKALSKKILAYHRIPCPAFAVFPRGQRVRMPRHLAFPLIVKSLTEESSLGISQASLVERRREAQRARDASSTRASAPTRSPSATSRGASSTSA